MANVVGYWLDQLHIDNNGQGQTNPTNSQPHVAIGHSGHALNSEHVPRDSHVPRQSQ